MGLKSFLLHMIHTTPVVSHGKNKQIDLAYSEHQTGLVLILSAVPNTKEAQWLAKHAYKFGLSSAIQKVKNK
ncbi:hypothetical protein [Bacillus pumilus]|uniref:hypothetical protein n=1 Tax=Bacillus pumilus TaxID=1408 RepID=UPI002FFDBD5F